MVASGDARDVGSARGGVGLRGYVPTGPGCLPPPHRTVRAVLPRRRTLLLQLSYYYAREKAGAVGREGLPAQWRRVSTSGLRR
jgi:hypothetical protein